MEMPDFQCEKTLTDFFDNWESVRESSSGRTITSKNYVDLVHSISGNLEEIKKSIDFFPEWKKEVAKVFKCLQPSVTQIIKGFKTPNNDGQHPSVTQSIEGPEMAINEGDAINELKHIKENVHEIKNGAEHIAKLPRVELKEKPKKRQTINWKTTMLDDKLGSPAMEMARSTYDGLENHLKLCFLSLSVFPENSIIRKRFLIYWWIGEGFVDGKDAEKKAEECFKKLCKSGLVEAVGERYSRSPRSCRLHPLNRRMAIEMAKKINFLDFDSDGKPLSGRSRCTRRAFVARMSGGGEEAAELRSEKVNLKPKPRELESLFNVDVNCIELDEEDFRKLNNVKTLQLGRWMTAPEHHIELLNPIFLTHLKQLKKLRYLGLQGISRITELAEIQHLGELRVLDLRACHNLEKLPEKIAKLKNLTHLDVSECYLLEYMPKGLGDLSELQLLNGFVVNTWSKKACKVRELTKLGKLEKLSISLGMEATVKDGVLDPIGEIKSLKSLRITWGSTPTEEENEDGTRTTTGWCRVRKATKQLNIIFNWSTDGLCLPPKLTKLDLECYPEKEPPLFKRKLTAEERLEKLYFRGGGLKSLRGMQIHDEVSKVRFIRLRFLKDFVMEKKDFKVEFPSLELMEAYECSHFPHQLEVVFPGEIASPQRKDEASTSANRST